MFSTPAPSEPAKMGNVDAHKLDSNQQTRPLPWHIGRHWFALTWNISDVYNYKASKKSSGGGKGGKGGGSQTVSTCDVAGLATCCLEDYLEAIEVNGDVVWAAGGGISRDGSHVEHTGDIVVPEVGTFRFHWGTETANGDWLVLNSGGEEHPHYRGQSVLEVKNLNCGSSGNPPNIRILLERAGRFDGLDEGRSREGANPITGQAELIEDDFFGAGMAGIVDADTGALIADALRDRTQTVSVPGNPTHTAHMSYVSAYLNERQSLSSVLSGIMENYDGWIRRNGEKLEFGRFTHEGITPAGLLELTLHDFVEDPEFPNLAPDHPDVITDAIVTGPDRDWNMEDSWQKGGNDATRDRIKETRIKTYSRPFLCTGYQQKEQAQEIANFYSVAAKESSVKFRREKIGNLLPGDRFILNYGPSLSRRVFRVTKLEEPAAGGTVTLSVIIERGLAPLTYVAPADPAPTLPQPPEAVAIVNARMFELPVVFTGSHDPVVVPLAERPAPSCSGFRVHFSIDGTTFDPMADTIDWALRGTLVSGIAAGDGTITIAAAGLDIALLEAKSDADQADDTLLLFVGSEILSIGDVTALGGGQYLLEVLRGRCATTAASHVGSSEIFIIPRAELLELRHASFPQGIGTRYFKLQSLAVGNQQDLSEALLIAFVFGISSVAIPSALTLLTDSTTSILQPDGTFVPRLKVTWNMPTDPAVLLTGRARIEYKKHTDPTWLVWAEIRGDRNVDYITDVKVGVSYDVRVQFEGLESERSKDGSGNEAWAEVDSYLIQGDTAAPAQLAAPTVTARPGYNEITWAKSADVDTVEYGVYRNTSNTTVGATKLGETAGLVWDDPTATPGVQYWYFVSAIDGFENESTKSAGANVTTALAPVGATVPTNPTAASRVTPGSNDTYFGGDGTVFSFFTIAVPAMPANAVWQNLLYRRAGATDWQIAAQLKNTGSTNVRLDDLTPGVSYEVASQAWSGAGGSAVITATSSPFTAPTKTSAPNNASNFAAHAPSSSYPVPPRYYSGVQAYGAAVTFDGSTSLDAEKYEYTSWIDNVSTPPDSNTGILIPKNPQLFYYYTLTLLGQFLCFRTWDRSGNKTPWLNTGINMNGYVSLAAGTMSVQNANAVNMSGVQVGQSGGSISKVLAIYENGGIVINLAGGTSETFTVSLSGCGFTTKPDVGSVQCIDPAGDVDAFYDQSNASNSSTQAVIKVQKAGGYSGGLRRFSVTLKQTF